MSRQMDAPDKTHRFRRRHFSENTAHQGNTEEKIQSNERKRHFYRKRKERYDVEQSHIRSRSRDSRPRSVSSAPKIQPCASRARSSDTRLCMQDTYTAGPAIICFLGVELQCTPSSHDELIQLCNDHGMKYTTLSLLESQFGIDITDINVQFNSWKEAEMSKTLINQHFKVSFTDISFLNENVSPSVKSYEPKI
ncbi:uncharacterized protein LOC117110497 [Anneissia japonica]|uniref:uncharacterized protein LOC117110497 n=1 Tax=Anneissia japonica TaxID=1529436 RepID=UPI0014256B36|nr:uncharacterized protein LOC117110497 [Anneissia japonica]XP_033109117.1 uncharacterized protein LOC117110497 [Anneissia japonica]XP_033109118.1 uncharacterized protein LOC117110497 [Anneissia japonica]